MQRHFGDGGGLQRRRHHVADRDAWPDGQLRFLSTITWRATLWYPKPRRSSTAWSSNTSKYVGKGYIYGYRTPVEPPRWLRPRCIGTATRGTSIRVNLASGLLDACTAGSLNVQQFTQSGQSKPDSVRTTSASASNSPPLCCAHRREDCTFSSFNVPGTSNSDRRFEDLGPSGRAVWRCYGSEPRSSPGFLKRFNDNIPAPVRFQTLGALVPPRPGLPSFGDHTSDGEPATQIPKGESLHAGRTRGRAPGTSGENAKACGASLPPPHQPGLRTQPTGTRDSSLPPTPKDYIKLTLALLGAPNGILEVHWLFTVNQMPGHGSF
ncbi:MAG: hypothetical protein CM15mP128_1370 [Methanobacteriota archaeon]|nr:MAG: hypothetical protein CM15mP128_1370 [Euryarchaeota archaeon]